MIVSISFYFLREIYKDYYERIKLYLLTKIMPTDIL